MLLDDNNRKTLGRLHFNGITTKYVRIFDGQVEKRNQIHDLTDIYMLSAQLEARISEIKGSKGK